MAAIPYLTIMIGGSTKRRNLLTIGFRILDRSLLRSLEIFRLEMVKTAPRRPPMIPRQAAGRNISTFTDMESPTFRQNEPFPTDDQRKPTKTTMADTLRAIQNDLYFDERMNMAPGAVVMRCFRDRGKYRLQIILLGHGFSSGEILLNHLQPKRGTRRLALQEPIKQKFKEIHETIRKIEMQFSAVCQK